MSSERNPVVVDCHAAGNATLTSVAVSMPVADVRVEHEIKLDGLTKWVERTGGSPRATCR
jgi:hypothetical protein